MKRAAIDTHALVWYLTTPKKLGKSATRWLRDAEAGRAEILIPAAVVVELALLREAGRRVPGPAEVQSLLAMQPGLRFAAMDLAQVVELVLLSGIPELFDRLIVASARAHGMPLITRDEAVVESGLVATLWD